jgi:hypothetical protein
LDGLTFHQLRHTAAAFMIRDGNLEHVKRRLGHAGISITLDLYGHISPEEDARLTAALDERRNRSLQDADQMLTESNAEVIQLSAVRAWTRRNSDKEVDQRRFELLTSPVRGVRSTN